MNPEHASGDDSFASAAGELIDEVQQTLREGEPHAPAGPRSPWMLPSVLGVVFMGVMTWNVWLLRSASPRLTASEARMGDGVMVFVATEAVKNYKAEHGELPRSLGDAGIDVPDLDYTARADGFTVVATGNAVPVRHDDDEPIDDFLLRMGISPPDSNGPAITPGGTR